MSGWTNNPRPTAWAAERDEGLRAFFLGTYARMGAALAVSAAAALIVASSPALYGAIFFTPLRWVVLLAPLVMAMAMGAALPRMSAEGALGLLIAFAAVMGLSLSSLVLAYTGESLVRALFITAGTFAATAAWGYATGTDLSRAGGVLSFAVIGLVLAGLVNLFLHSTGLHLLMSALGVLVFSGLIAVDNQRLRIAYLEGWGEPGRMATIGALSLYLDTVNLFVSLIGLTGDRR